MYLFTCVSGSKLYFEADEVTGIPHRTGLNQFDHIPVKTKYISLWWDRIVDGIPSQSACALENILSVRRYLFVYFHCPFQRMGGGIKSLQPTQSHTSDISCFHHELECSELRMFIIARPTLLYLGCRWWPLLHSYSHTLILTFIFIYKYVYISNTAVYNAAWKCGGAQSGCLDRYSPPELGIEAWGWVVICSLPPFWELVSSLRKNCCAVSKINIGLTPIKLYKRTPFFSLVLLPKTNSPHSLIGE